ncbi:hypothetical protein ACFOZY_08415 [Chungangia koreensis]|uniref:Uncharacterized protein n=1 Tax=Chungangia koreensis TaxID=752657 RepID=A0ABV8X3E3_9LACT
MRRIVRQRIHDRHPVGPGLARARGKRPPGAIAPGEIFYTN